MKTIRKIISILLIIIIIVCAGYIIFEYKKAHEASEEIKQIQNIVYSNNKEEEEGFTKETFKKLKQENNEFVGYMQFDSGIIQLPIVKTHNNEKYLNYSFYNKYSEQGTPFMDAYSNESDTNIIFYAHNVYYDDTAMFSPLIKLIKQEDYEKNSTFSIYFENERRDYAITNIYYLDEETYQTYNYQQPFFNEGEFTEWIKYPNDNNLIRSIHGNIKNGNRFITLSTCKKWEEDTRVVVLAKELLRKKY